MTEVKNLMLVDDDLDDQEIFTLALEEIDLSLNCSMASSSASAFDTLTNFLPIPQLIFLDLNLPRINGRECLSQLKNNPSFQHIPVIIYTTSDNIRDITETKNLGAYAFITKPSTIDELVTALRPFLLHHNS